eukprot:scaffold1906_cov184-Pinguiococcus_pyrenoidosus.AAC.3
MPWVPKPVNAASSAQRLPQLCGWRTERSDCFSDTCVRQRRRQESRKGHAILRQVRAAEKFEQVLQGNPSDPDKLAAGCGRCCDKPDREEYPDVLPRTLIKEQPSRLLN